MTSTLPSPARHDAERHQLSMTVLMTPELANFAGHVHGGHILRLLDQVAYACASRWADAYVVTLSVDRVVFRAPVRVGELVTFDATVNYTGSTSMEIGIRVTTEDVHRTTTRHTNSCYFTMVALGEDRHPTRVPPLTPADDTAERRWHSAERRRADRLA